MPAISTTFALEQRPVTTVAWWEHVMNLATTWNRGHGPLLQAYRQASRGRPDPAGVLSGIAGVVRSRSRFVGNRGPGPRSNPCARIDAI